MNRQTPARSQPQPPQPQPFPPGYRPAGGQPGFPPVSQLGGRTAPPGFGSRNQESSDFPALGSHPSNNPQGSSSSQHLPPQQLFMQGAVGLAPPPPPGISSQHSNGDEFPALSGGEGARVGFMRNIPPPSSQSPPSLANGTASTSATPSTNAPIPSSGHLPNVMDRIQQEPVIRSVQQILTSPADKWGLKALLYDIKVNMGKTDRGMLLFGEELSELGIDITSEEPLYPGFVTPWAEPGQIQHPVRTEEPFHIPQCYLQVGPPSVSTKVSNFTEDTLFFAFYANPQDVMQFEVAAQLFERGWRYHTELQTWLNSPSLLTVDPSSSSPNWQRGPFTFFDARTWTRSRTADDFMVDASLLEQTRPAVEAISLAKSQQQGESVKSPNGTGAAMGTGSYGR